MLKTIPSMAPSGIAEGSRIAHVRHQPLGQVPELNAVIFKTKPKRSKESPNPRLRNLALVEKTSNKTKNI